MQLVRTKSSHSSIGLQPFSFFLWRTPSYWSSERCYEIKVRVSNVFPVRTGEVSSGALWPSTLSTQYTDVVREGSWALMAVVIFTRPNSSSLAPAVFSGEGFQATLPPGSWGFPELRLGKLLAMSLSKFSREEPDHKPLRSRKQTELGQLALFLFHICKIIPKIIIQHNVVTLFFGNTALEWRKKDLKNKSKQPIEIMWVECLWGLLSLGR